jgi:uncharacterized oxidoreductase
MQLSGNTILITGGSSGIGMALAERLAAANTVIICGRTESTLNKMKERIPALHVRVSDTGKAQDRESLARAVSKEFPNLNVLINNAGIQRKVNMQNVEAWNEIATEIDINLAGPIHLSGLLIPHLAKQKSAHIMNVSSGLAFAPLAHMPVYCATKAALHSFTLSLRQQLKNTSIAVTEIIPPAVKTNLGGSHDFGVELADFADSVMKQLEAGKTEVTYGTSEKSSQASRSELDQIFRQMNQV